jgi:hypothetical protein
MSSPVRFDSADITAADLDLRPQPLRILPHKSKTSSGDSDASALPESAIPNDSLSQDTGKPHAASPPRHDPTELSSRLRAKTSRLGLLVSKFEILDAVNNADTDLSRIPQPSKNKPTSQARAPAESMNSCVVIPRRAVHRSTYSAEESSSGYYSPHMPPRHVKLPEPHITRSRLPVGTRCKTTAKDDTPKVTIACQSPRDGNTQTDNPHCLPPEKSSASTPTMRAG